MSMRKPKVRWSDLDKSDIPLETLIAQFDTYNQTVGKSSKTRQWYKTSLSQFQRYLKRQNLSTQLGELDIYAVREFVQYLQTSDMCEGHPWTSRKGERLSSVSVHTKVRAIRAFFSWLHKEGFTEENILQNLTPPKMPKRFVKVLSQDETEAILRAMDSDNSIGARDLAIMLILFDTGLRLSEVSGLKMADVSLDRGYMKVFGKGSKERIVPIGSTVTSSVQRYISFFRAQPAYPDLDRVFLTIDGYPLTANTIYLMVKRLGQKAGVERLYPHLCRHLLPSTT